MNKMMTGYLSKMLTVPLLDAKTSAGLFIHVIRELPCVRGVTMIIMHLNVAQQKIQLIRL